MGIKNLDNPARCGEHVAQYDNWNMANIINVFANGLDVDTKLKFRRALLVSYEARALIQGGRINV